MTKLVVQCVELILSVTKPVVQQRHIIYHVKKCVRAAVFLDRMAAATTSVFKSAIIRDTMVVT